jgi:hypothetical protein
VIKAFAAIGTIAELTASPVLAMPIDVITIEAILLTAISLAAAIRAMLSDSYSRASALKIVAGASQCAVLNSLSLAPS